MGCPLIYRHDLRLLQLSTYKSLISRLHHLFHDSSNENIGRGLRSKISKQDKLLMTLCYLKHYETIDKMKDTFSISKSYLHSLLQSTIEVITPHFYEYFVTHLQDRIEDYESEEDQLFPDAKFVMDATSSANWRVFSSLSSYSANKSLSIL